HFLSMLPRSPNSPLFPYTTLFRSDFRQVVIARRAADFPAISRMIRSEIAVGSCVQLPGADQLVQLGLCQARSFGCVARTRCSAQDRKSTRLNSSHVAISYAVFCLK